MRMRIDPRSENKRKSLVDQSAVVVVVVAIGVAADRSSTVVAAIDPEFRIQNMKIMTNRSVGSRSIDPSFRCRQQSENNIDVPPLLRTESTRLN